MRERRRISMLCWVLGGLISIAGCSLDSGLEGAACSNEGATSGDRVCKNGYWVQTGSQDGGVSDAPSGDGCLGEELCNGSDDTCDGVVDEGCSCDWKSKTVGVCAGGGTVDSTGECQAPKSYVEDEGAGGAGCGDQVDNDCDGRTDEGCACHAGDKRSCYDGDSGTAGVGICTRGEQTCSSSSTWGKCEGQQLPKSKEDCENDKDDNCNGTVNEGCGCSYMNKSVGVCADQERNPDGTCPKPSTWEMPKKRESQCDGQDNDCDGHTDEGCPCDYKGLSKGVCMGSTRDQKGDCQKPGGFESMPSSDEASCDGKDNDCDGMVDDGCDCNPTDTKPCYNGPSGTAGTGVCTEGTLTCQSDGTWGSCKGEETPSKDVCGDGKDNDCDGAADEGCPCDYKGNSSGVCGTARRDQNDNCAEPAAYVSPTNDEKPDCEGKDNDCDGQTDEGCQCTNGKTGSCYSGPSGTDGTGICHTGTRSCSRGTWGACMNEQTPRATETCNDSKDTNCNGVNDDGCPCNYKGTAQGVCQGSIIDASGSCRRPGDFVSMTNDESPECDGKDNDCDGATDEGCPCDYDMSSDGVCGTATRDSSGTCTQPSGYVGTEDNDDCDGKDNDCDGRTDEQCGCTYDPGETDNVDTDNSHGSGVCTGQSKDRSGVCQAPSGFESRTMSESSCMNDDNDCDGNVDEGCPCNYQGDSDGVCGMATNDASGTCSKPGDFEGNESSCADTKDNDCDGKADAADSDCTGLTPGSLCVLNSQCISGLCVSVSGQAADACAHRIFATSETKDGKFGGLSGADAACQKLATDAGLNGSWKAVLSTNSTDAKSRLTVSAPVYNTKGSAEKIFDDASHMWSTSTDLHTQVGYDETGSQVDARVWTGTTADGTASSDTCSGWTNKTGAISGTFGHSNDNDTTNWIGQGTDQCSKARRVYCIDGQ